MATTTSALGYTKVTKPAITNACMFNFDIKTYPGNQIEIISLSSLHGNIWSGLGYSSFVILAWMDVTIVNQYFAIHLSS